MHNMLCTYVLASCYTSSIYPIILLLYQIIYCANVFTLMYI